MSVEGTDSNITEEVVRSEVYFASTLSLPCAKAAEYWLMARLYWPVKNAESPDARSFPTSAA